MNGREEFNEENGFTLVELLVAILVVGILTAVALVGIGGLTDTAKGATCQTTLDASRAAVVSFYSKQSPHAYPTSFDAMTAGATPDLVLQGGIQHPTALTLESGGSPTKWTIALNPATGALSASGTDAGNCS
jgi:prepilin-type N-terminal cleavage/methylation domain-containing protein